MLKIQKIFFSFSDGRVVACCLLLLFLGWWDRCVGNGQWPMSQSNGMTA